MFFVSVFPKILGEGGRSPLPCPDNGCSAMFSGTSGGHLVARSVPECGHPEQRGRLPAPVGVPRGRGLRANRVDRPRDGEQLLEPDVPGTPRDHALPAAVPRQRAPVSGQTLPQPDRHPRGDAVPQLRPRRLRDDPPAGNSIVSRVSSVPPGRCWIRVPVFSKGCTLIWGHVPGGPEGNVSVAAWANFSALHCVLFVIFYPLY